MKAALLILSLTTVLLLQGCETPPSKPPAPAPAPAQTVRGYGPPVPIRTIRYTDGMMCEEKPSDVGVQCYCRNQWLDPYTMRSKKPGYYTECRDQLEVNRLLAEAQQRAAEEAAKKKRDEAEAAKKSAEFARAAEKARPLCEALAQRWSRIELRCSAAGNPSHCQQVNHSQQIFPAPLNRAGRDDLGNALLGCTSIGYRVSPAGSYQDWMRGWFR